MTTKRCIDLGRAVALASLVPASVAGAQTGVTIGRSVEATYQHGSREARDIQQWLMDHAEYRGANRVGDPSLIADVAVHYTALPASDRTPNADANAPTLPPPSGHDGDTVAIRSCGGGARQTWQYTWVGPSTGGWNLTAYRYTLDHHCAASGD